MSRTKRCARRGKSGKRRHDTQARKLPGPDNSRPEVMRACGNVLDATVASQKGVEGSELHASTVAGPDSLVGNVAQQHQPKDVEVKESCHFSVDEQMVAGLSPDDAEHLTGLRALVVPVAQLKQSGYVFDTITSRELGLKMYCTGCGRSMENFSKRKGLKGEKNLKQKEESRGNDMITPQKPESAKADTNQSSSSASKASNPVLRCRFHTGTVKRTPIRDGYPTRKLWTCCKQGVSSPPCSGAEQHIPDETMLQQLTLQWQYWPTPSPTRSNTIRAAVAIDCEMGVAKTGDSEVIRVTLVDYFSDDVLIDNLVFPTVAMQHMNTMYSGVTWKDMEESRNARTCFFGRDSARKAVWEFVGPDTIVVGHSPNNDFKALRWIHRTVVDTHLLDVFIPKETSEKRNARETMEQMDHLSVLVARKIADERFPTLTAIAPEIITAALPSVAPFSDLISAPPSMLPPEYIAAVASNKGNGRSRDRKTDKKKGPRSLQVLTWEKLGREIQCGDKHGHDSLEDALATRDLARFAVKEMAIKKALEGE